MGGITITNSSSRLTKTLRLVSTISSFLFEEQYGEMQFWSGTERKALASICKRLHKRATITKK